MVFLLMKLVNNATDIITSLNKEESKVIYYLVSVGAQNNWWISRFENLLESVPKDSATPCRSRITNRQFLK
jgi:hypothetical protein